MKTFNTLAALALIAASAPSFAGGGWFPNGLELNGTTLNGGGNNGTSATGLQSMTVYAVTLPDEAQTEAK